MSQRERADGQVCRCVDHAEGTEIGFDEATGRDLFSCDGEHLRRAVEAVHLVTPAARYAESRPVPHAASTATPAERLSRIGCTHGPSIAKIPLPGSSYVAVRGSRLAW